MKLRFFSRKFVRRLHETAGEHAAQYSGDMLWLEDLAAGQPYVHESNLVVDPPPILEVSTAGSVNQDAVNSRRIYTWLRQLTPALAMEERLWAWLTHCVFADYMHARWPAVGEDLVRRRYLFEGQSFDALARNGIARLWWGGRLTWDEAREDPFELTDILFMRQDIQVSLLERRIGKCRNVRVPVLEYLRDNKATLAEARFTKRIQVLLRELNLLGGIAVLDALPPVEIQGFLKKVAAGFSSLPVPSGRD